MITANVSLHFFAACYVLQLSESPMSLGVAVGCYAVARIATSSQIVSIV